jgi:hypothetical protein
MIEKYIQVIFIFPNNILYKNFIRNRIYLLSQIELKIFEIF